MSAAPAPETLTLRSLPVLITGSVLSMVLVGGSAALWVGMDPIARSEWTWPQIATIVFFLVVIVAVVMGIGLSKVSVGPDGVTIRNAVQVNHYGWDQVDDFVMAPGDSWVHLQLVDDDQDGAAHMVLAVQRAEGDRADEHLAQLRAMVRRYKQS